jgi:hypothetical protein
MTRPITIDDCRAWGSCYTVRGNGAYLLDLFLSGSATPREILDEERLSLADRGWILSRALAEWDRPGLVAWARESADISAAAYIATAAAAYIAAHAARAAANAAAANAADAAARDADLAATLAADAAYIATAAADSDAWDRAYRERLEACVVRLEKLS